MEDPTANGKHSLEKKSTPTNSPRPGGNSPKTEPRAATPEKFEKTKTNGKSPSLEPYSKSSEKAAEKSPEPAKMAEKPQNPAVKAENVEKFEKSTRNSEYDSKASLEVLMKNPKFVKDFTTYLSEAEFADVMYCWTEIQNFKIIQKSTSLSLFLSM